MSKGNSRRVAREQKYSVTSNPPYPVRPRDWGSTKEPKPTKHGKPPEKPERPERWQ